MNPFYLKGVPRAGLTLRTDIPHDSLQEGCGGGTGKGPLDSSVDSVSHQVERPSRSNAMCLGGMLAKLMQKKQVQNRVVSQNLHVSAVFAGELNAWPGKI